MQQMGDFADDVDFFDGDVDTARRLSQRNSVSTTDAVAPIITACILCIGWIRSDPIILIAFIQSTTFCVFPSLLVYAAVELTG